MTTIGKHLIVELYQCDSSCLDDPKAVEAALAAGVEAVGATEVARVIHQFAPSGVTGVFVIAESHFSIHTWPEHGYAAIDIYTCGGLDPIPGMTVLGEMLGADRIQWQQIVRGLPDGFEGENIGSGDVQTSTNLVPEHALQVGNDG